MRVFVAGATGAIGRALLPQLLEKGHEVVALCRNAEKAKGPLALGAETVVADPLDREGLIAAIRAARPEAIVHELTALAAAGNFKKFDEEFALTNRFRTEVTDTLLAAARHAGARRFIAQSYCDWPFAREGGPVKTEEDPLDPDPPSAFRRILSAIRYLEDAVRRAGDLEAFALRYGALYGPGTGIAKDGPIVGLLARRRVPIVGDGRGVWSFVHVRDAARATVEALWRGTPGVYNVVDDDPAPVSQWLPYLARAVGAGPPRRIPRWLAKLAIGEGGVMIMTEARGADNAKARRELGWQPAYPSWRQGFAEGLG
jgi:nucleoside-diphosphate-sugar epimerase